MCLASVLHARCSMRMFPPKPSSGGNEKRERGKEGGEFLEDFLIAFPSLRCLASSFTEQLGCPGPRVEAAGAH